MAQALRTGHHVHQRLSRISIAATICGLVLLLLPACTPTVKVQAPSEPITINLNIKLDAEVRLKLEKEAEEDITKNPEIF
jgi:hypothetical protein